MVGITFSPTIEGEIITPQSGERETTPTI
jgi:hypothetical protein